MNITKTKFVQADVTADSTSAGIVTVASTTDFRIGAKVFVYYMTAGVMTSSTACKIIDIPSNTALQLGLDTTMIGSGGPSYSGCDLSAYTLARASVVVQNEQLLPQIGQGVLVTTTP